MKKLILTLTTVGFLIGGFATTLVAQAFEGVIEFKKATNVDTTSYIYYVKGDKVRIDEMGTKSHKVEGTFLIDLKAKTMIALNIDRKLYTNQPTRSTPVMKGTCSIKKGATVKTIQGVKCTEYIVTNTEDGTVVTYYIADGKYTFFEPLLHLLNRKEQSSMYYHEIQGISNSFPMLSVQTDLSGKPVSRLEVTKMTTKTLDSGMFDMPKGFKAFEK